MLNCGYEFVSGFPANMNSQQAKVLYFYFSVVKIIMIFCPCDINKEAQKNNVTIDYMPFETLRGCIVKFWEKHHVWISENLPERSMRQTIAHELAHLETDTVDSVWAFRSEWRAYKRAREILVDENSLKKLIDDWYSDFSSLASLFWVTEKMIQLRCKDLELC